MTSPRGGSDKRVARVLVGYTNLTSAEQSDFIAKLNDYERSSAGERQTKKASFSNTATRMDVGPTATGCTCCGR
ncbi:hypothetical protein [Nocardia nova]|uniref:hypothetical protein n=1 Tax=Nocardia nova TaxID=37330 RepID=UPI001894C4C5|nr:hypothetical protein [Nocardia nova]MBF6278052.1 hypothetical protein [Nocardia nova]